MKKHKIIFWTATIVAVSILTTSCFNNKKPKTMTDTIQKITPCFSQTMIMIKVYLQG